MIKGRFFTAANIVSILRIPLTGIACYFLWNGEMLYTFIFMVLAILSDAVDGQVARRTGTVSDWGKILDPLADKIAFTIFAITLLLKHLVPLWFFAILIGRDLLIIAGGLLFYRKASPPSSNIWGKLATTVLSIYMLRQAIFPQIQFPNSEVFYNIDFLGLLSILLVVFSFFTYVFSAFKSGKVTNAT